MQDELRDAVDLTLLYRNLKAISACEPPSGAVKIAIRRAAQQFSIFQKNVQLGE